jgi:hypothetical protein
MTVTEGLSLLTPVTPSGPCQTVRTVCAHLDVSGMELFIVSAEKYGAR